MASERRLSCDEVEVLANEAVTVIPGTVHANIVLLCEHGGRRVPAPWNNLGLAPALLDTHFGSDIGAADLTRMLARDIGATAIIANYSRLFLDYNRRRSDPDCWRMEMGGIPIPGNLDLTAAEIELRETIARVPVEQTVASWTEQRPARAVISIHSFSPYWNNARRECEVGVMWRDDARLAPRLIEELSKQGEYVVRDNEPYDFRTSDWFTLQRHGLEIGVPCAYVEVRNDLINAFASRRKMAQVLSRTILASCGDTTSQELQRNAQL